MIDSDIEQVYKRRARKDRESGEGLFVTISLGGGGGGWWW